MMLLFILEYLIILLTCFAWVFVKIMGGPGEIGV